MRSINLWQWSLALLSGLLQALIFPSPNLYPLCWIALAPLLVAILQPPRTAAVISPGGHQLTTTRWHGFLLGYACGVLWYAGSCFWVYHAMHWYGGLSASAALGVLALFCLYLGLYHGLFGFLLAAARRGGLRHALLLTPFLWVAVELARARITGFPWDLLGGSQVENIPLTRVAVFTGVYGVSLTIALVNTGIAAALMAPPRRRRRLLCLALALALVLQAGIFFRPAPLPAPNTALLVQPNLPMDVNWTRAALDQTIQQLTAISALPAQSSGPRLVIWPESPAPFFSNDASLATALESLARQQDSYLVVSLVGVLPLPAGARYPPGAEPPLTNRAALVAPDATPAAPWAAYYDKIHLVPFGEYVPMPKLFAFASGLTQQVGNFVPGSARVPLAIAGHRYGTFICYESVFPDEIRQFAANGAEVLLNLSDDGWYGAYGAPGQHLNMARMRAVENHRWLLRATNTGVTAAIDPFGRIVARAPSDRRTRLLAPYGFISATTFYTRHGDWLAGVCVIISMLGLMVRVRVKAMSSAATRR